MAFIANGAAAADFQSANSRGLVPLHDLPDIPFRRAPMGRSSRSIVVSLAINLHLAFDAKLLITHSVWEGERLNLYGPPFTDNATKFICDFTGKLLWENLPIQPWEFGGSDFGAGEFKEAPARFLGVSTKAGRTGFFYELLPVAGASVLIRETPKMEPILSRTSIIRTFQISPHNLPIRFSPFHGSGASVPLPEGQNAVAVRRESDFLAVAVRGLAANILNARRDDAAHFVLVQSERDGKGPYSVVLTNTVSGPQTKITLTLPPTATEQVFEIAIAICVDSAAAAEMTKAFTKTHDKPSQISLNVDTSKSSLISPPLTLTPDPTYVDKLAGDESFTVEHFPVPKEIRLLVGGMDFLPNGDLAICTYAGEIWIVEGATGPPSKARWRRFARGLNEPGGLRVVNGQIYVTQKCELTRVTDTDANGEADLFECISDGWGYTGNYHSFATGPMLDALGNFYVMITGHRTIYDVPFMGWCLKISPNAGLALPAKSTNSRPTSALEASVRYVTEGFCSGLRVPNGFGEFNGEIFMTDNQGHWIAANKLNHLQPGKFYGHPSARPAPKSLFDGDPNFEPPVIWFPYAWMRSASGIAAIEDARFGPFRGQMLVGEFQNASVFRVALERVDGEWQGAVFPFVKGFASGVNRIAFGPDGKLYAGGLRMGHWTSIAPRPYSLDRVTFTGRIPFEIQEVRARPDGFVLSFTQMVDPASAGNVENWDATQYAYGYDGHHNAPEKDRDEKIPGPPVRVTKAIVSADQRSVRLQIEGCQSRNVIMVHAQDVKNSNSQPLRNDTFHYTLNRIPAR